MNTTVTPHTADHGGETSDGHVDDHDDFGGLHRDRATLLGRRRALVTLGSAGLAGIATACMSTPGSGGGLVTTTTIGGSSGEIPDETAGPYPADGSNGPNVLDDDGILRADITRSFGAYAGVAAGIPTRFELTVVDAATGNPKAGAAVYLWHCTATGQYSVYEVTNQNYLRGVQVADTSGLVSFASVFPGCYAGRWPHCHFEVYDTVAQATAGSSAIKTSQLALPQSNCQTVYADSRYGNSTSNLGRLSLSTDGIFRDGWTSQLATVSGSNAAGYTASLLVRV